MDGVPSFFDFELDDSNFDNYVKVLKKNKNKISQGKVSIGAYKISVFLKKNRSKERGSVAEASRLIGVEMSLISNAKQVIDLGSKELALAVEVGDVNVQYAARQLNKSIIWRSGKWVNSKSNKSKLSDIYTIVENLKKILKKSPMEISIIDVRFGVNEIWEIVSK